MATPQDDRVKLDRQYEGVSLYRLETPDGESRYIIAGSMLEALRKYEIVTRCSCRGFSMRPSLRRRRIQLWRTAAYALNADFAQQVDAAVDRAIGKVKP